MLGGCGGASEPTTTKAELTTSPPPTTPTTTIITSPLTTTQTPTPSPSTTTPTTSPPTTTQTTTPSPSSTTPTQTAKPIQGSDKYITVILDNVKKTSVLPADIKTELSSSHAGIPTLLPGYTFVCVYFRVIDISVHMTAFGYNKERPLLVTAQNNKYEMLTGWVAVELVNPNDFAHSNSEVPEGAKGVLIFQLPTQQEPQILKFMYEYKISWEGNYQRGEIDISLD
jgi:hypothetical protein